MQANLVGFELKVPMHVHHVHNETPFPWFAFEKMAPGRTVCDVVIVKACVPLSHDANAPAPTPEQASASPIHYADLPHTSELGAYAPLREAGDLVLAKLATDLWLNGTATPASPGTREWTAHMTLRDANNAKRYRQTLALTGPRYWQWSLRKGWHLTPPEPVTALPLRYELAYGGSYTDKDVWHHYPANPAGRGWMPHHRRDTRLHYPAAQIECIDQRLQHIETPVAVPALGPLPRPWHARQQYVGTYDQAWYEQADHPLGRDYPADFDLRFFQAAPPGQQFTPRLGAGACLELMGLTGEQPVYGRIPRWCPALQEHEGKSSLTAMWLDTVVADLDTMSLHLTWRCTLRQPPPWSTLRMMLLHPDR